MASKIIESLDTNIILRIMLHDIPEQCLRIVDLFMRPGYVYHISDLAITEAVYVMQKDYTRNEIVFKLTQLMDLPNLNMNYNMLNQALPLYLSHPKLSFNDCCLAIYAKLNDAEPLWTFDQAMLRQLPNTREPQITTSAV